MSSLTVRKTFLAPPSLALRLGLGQPSPLQSPVSSRGRSEAYPMSGPLSAPDKKVTTLKRVAILFAGGPAPAANAVISTAAAAFQRNDIEVLGILYGYSQLAEYSPERPLVEGVHFVKLQSSLLKRSRNTQ